jgi:hypothetical protein
MTTRINTYLSRCLFGDLGLDCTLTASLLDRGAMGSRRIREMYWCEETKMNQPSMGINRIYGYGAGTGMFLTLNFTDPRNCPWVLPLCFRNVTPLHRFSRASYLISIRIIAQYRLAFIINTVLTAPAMPGGATVPAGTYLGWPDDVTTRARIKNALPCPIPVDPLGQDVCRSLRPYVQPKKKLELSQATECRSVLWYCWRGHQSLEFLKFLDDDEYFQDHNSRQQRVMNIFAQHITPIIGILSAKQRKNFTRLDSALQERTLNLFPGE